MPNGAWAVIAWICIGAFGVCVLAGLCIMLGVWRPKDDDVRKRLLNILFSGVIGSILVGVGILFARPSQAGDNRHPDPSTYKPVEVVTPQPGPVQERDSVPHPPPVDPALSEPNPATAQAAIPAELRAWAEEALGARPELSPLFERNYPPCVAELRERTTSEAAPIDGHQCATRLLEHRRLYIGPLLAERQRYADQILSQLGLLNGRELSADDLPRYNFLTREKRYFFIDGPEARRYRDADQRSTEDLGLCQASGCRRPT